MRKIVREGIEEPLLKQEIIFIKNSMDFVRRKFSTENPKLLKDLERKGFFKDDAETLSSAKKNAEKRTKKALDRLLNKEKGALVEYIASNVGFPFSNVILIKMTLVYSIMLFEQMLKEYLSFYLMKNPTILKSKTFDKAIKQERVVEFSVLLGVKSVKELRKLIVDKEADRIGRLNLEEIDNFFSRRTNLLLSEKFEKWEKLRKYYYLRNLVVHNGGIMNSQIHNKIKFGVVGKQIKLGIKEIRELINVIVELNKLLYENFGTKLQIR